MLSPQIKEEIFMRINTNLIAMNTYNQYTKNNNAIASSVEKLSSGYSINSASDNAAGLAISEKMRAQIRGLDQASSNSQDAISLTQTAEGALSSSTEILQRMREISVQSSSDTNENDVDRGALQDEFSQLQDELDDISSTTTFNNKNLLDGSLAASTASLSKVSLANTTMKISTGNVAAGDYKFNISTKEETASVAGQAGTTSASLGTVAQATFSGVASTSNPSTVGALYNGDYTLSTTINSDKSLTINAKGDNGQSFTATLSTADLAKVDKTNFNAGNAANSTLALNFVSSNGASDGFGATLTLKSYVDTGSDNGLTGLSEAINNVTVAVDGGVDTQAATYGVYASLTGGDSVKLNAGDTGVSFSNGVTVNFDKLTATDVAVGSYNADEYSYAVGNTAGDFDIASIFSGAASGSTYKVDVTGGTLTNGTSNLSTVTFKSATVSGGNVIVTVNDGKQDYTATNAIGDYEVAASLSLSFSGADGTSTLTGTVATDKDNSGSTLVTSGTDATGTSTDTLTTITSTKTGVVINGGPTLSKGILNKMGSDTDLTAANSAAVTKTSDSTFSVTKTANKGLTFQVGANEGDEMTINIDKMDSQTLGVSSAKVDTQKAASAAIKTVNTAINSVSSQRAYLGAIENRLNYKINNLGTSSENLTSAESEIRDVDMASEMTKFTNANILSKAATAMLAQANSLPQNVLSLLQ